MTRTASLPWPLRFCPYSSGIGGRADDFFDSSHGDKKTWYEENAFKHIDC